MYEAGIVGVGGTSNLILDMTCRFVQVLAVKAEKNFVDLQVDWAPVILCMGASVVRSYTSWVFHRFLFLPPHG